MRSIIVFINILLVLFFSGCASKYADDIKNNSDANVKNSSKNIANIMDESKYVVFTINKDKSISIFSVRSTLEDSNIDDINAFNKYSKTEVRDCVFIEKDMYTTCTSGIQPNIYIHDKFKSKDALIATIVSPLSLAIDILNFDTSLSSTRKMYVDKEVDYELVRKVGSIINNRLVNEYSEASKNSSSLEKFIDKYNIHSKRGTNLYNELLALYIKENTFETMLKTYEKTRDFKYMQNAYKLANKRVQRNKVLATLKANRDWKGLLNIYRSYHNFEGYINAFKISHNQSDMDKAYHMAKTEDDKRIIQAMLN